MYRYKSRSQEFVLAKAPMQIETREAEGVRGEDRKGPRGVPLPTD